MTQARILTLAIVLASCGGGVVRTGNSFHSIDSLVAAQVEHLTSAGYQLEKNAEVDDEGSSVTIRPDSAGWAQELSVFRELEISARPTYRDRYVITDGEDRNSNLRVRSYEATESPVPFIRFYYLDHPGDVRRIEAAYYETNALYTSRRELVLEFEEAAGVRMLKSYRIDGFQKISLADSVHYAVSGKIIF
jgi:hypothetical protein